MSEEQPPAVPDANDRNSAPPETCDATPPSTGGAKLFVIFFLAIVPLLGFAIVGMVIYHLLVR